jgi:hypothetical protein
MSMAAFLLALSGCAAALDPAAAPIASPVEAASDSNRISESESAEIAIVKQVEISSLPLREEPSQCEDLTRPGSRIVVARRCRSIDEEALADQLNQVRREQETLDRLARERENRRGGL